MANTHPPTKRTRRNEENTYKHRGKSSEHLPPILEELVNKEEIKNAHRYRGKKSSEYPPPPMTNKEQGKV